LAAPTALKIVRTDQLGVSLDWAPVPGAIGYRLYVNGKQVGAAVVFSQAYVPLPKRKTSYNVGVAAIANNGQTTSAQSTVQVTTK
jgi:hypothetical protein